MTRRMGLLSVVLFGSLLSFGCTETKVVRSQPFLSHLPGAETQAETSGPRWAGYRSPAAAPGGSIVIEQEDGSKTLVARSGRHLMTHVYNTLTEDDEALFTEQVLSSVTRAEFVERGLPASAAFAALKERERDVLRLFSMMPQGEYTPGVLMKRVGEGMYRLRVSGPGTSRLRWRFMDMVMEGGNWRLRWFG
ncbi:MAG: hypothetical protein AAF297_08840 [Planctomycetota bacterium]